MNLFLFSLLITAAAAKVSIVDFKEHDADAKSKNHIRQGVEAAAFAPVDVVLPEADLEDPVPTLPEDAPGLPDDALRGQLTADEDARPPSVAVAEGRPSEPGLRSLRQPAAKGGASGLEIKVSVPDLGCPSLALQKY